MARFLASLLCFLLLFPLPAHAQQALSVRAGVHDDYTRLVFDWSADAGYTVSRSGGEMIISFDKDATVAPPDADGAIKAFRVLSTSPLKVSVTIPENSRARDFKIGSRVIVDVYNPDGAPKTEAKKEEPKAEKTAAAEKPKTEKPKAPPQETKKPETKTAAPAEEAKTAQVPPVAAPAPEQVPAAPQPYALAPHVITFTATQSVGMAVYEEGGRLWMVTDLAGFDIKPQLNGPSPEKFAGFQETDIEQGRMYATQLPEGARLAPQGGGLLWRYVVSAKPNAKKPSDPQRQGTEGAPAKIFWPFKEAHKVIPLSDPLTGERLIVATSENSGDYAGRNRAFVDFDVLTSHVGLAIRPKVDDLEVKIVPGGVEISRPGGLALMPEEQLSMARQEITLEKQAPEPPPGQEAPAPAAPKTTAPSQRIFSFAEWQMGGPDVLTQNEMAMMSSLHEKPDGQKYEDLMTLARMYLANARGAEALGFLNYALTDLPGLDSNPDFLALRGVAYDLSGDAESAFRDLSIADLQSFPEIQYWRAYALASLGDWQQAHDILPPSLNALFDYPDILRYELALVLAEIELRAGQTANAETLLKTAAQFEKTMPLPYLSALNYLRGELARQKGDKEKAKEYWEPLTVGKDDLYRAKAGLALTRFQFENGEIDAKAAIDKLERLRYAWRGDELEASINYWLGKVYFDTGERVKGLSIMRDAASYAPGTKLAQRIAAEMRQSFEGLFADDKIESLSALDAMTLYEQFAELMPPGEEGEKIVQKIAERLVNADLLDRGGDLLQKQLDAGTLKTPDAARVALRLGAIRLLDRQPDKAFAALDKAEAALAALKTDPQTPAREREIALMRARGFSLAKNPNKALALLAGMAPGADVNRLKADIAWQAGYWEDAADALKDVIADENITLSRPLEDDQANLILHRAIALNLTGDRVALADLREQYSSAMTATKMARPFEVVTRPRQNASLADRQTLLDMVSEVDLFSEFLNAYKADQPPSN